MAVGGDFVAMFLNVFVYSGFLQRFNCVACYSQRCSMEFSWFWFLWGLILGVVGLSRFCRGVTGMFM